MIAAPSSRPSTMVVAQSRPSPAKTTVHCPQEKRKIILLPSTATTVHSHYVSAKTFARHDCHAQQNLLAIAAIDRSLFLPRQLRIPRRTLTTHNSHLTQHAHHGMTTPTIHGIYPAHPPFSTTPPPVALLTTAVPVRWHHGCLLQLTITY